MKRSYLLTSLCAVFALVLSACGADTSTPTTAILTSPKANAEFTAGQTVPIQGTVNGSAVKKVQVVVNNQPVAEVDQAVEAGKFEIAADFPLLANSLGGSNVIELRGLDESNKAIVTSEPVFIRVIAQAAPTALPEPTSIPTAVPVPPTPTPATGAVVTGTAPLSTTAPVSGAVPAPAGNSVLNKDNEFVNVRKGPGLTFDIVGQFKQTQNAKVTGKSEDGAWWQIDLQGVPDNSGWVFGQLVQFSGDAAAVKAIKVAVPTAAPAAVVPTQPVVAIATQAPAAAPTSPPAAVLPYSQNFRFGPRDDIGDVPLGYKGEGNSSKIQWQITGAQRAEIEVSTPGANGLFACPVGNLAGIQPNSIAGKRFPLQLPSGELPFTITEKGLYQFTIHVVKADGSTTTIPRWVIYDCFKTQ